MSAFCRHCGQECPREALFCTKCGCAPHKGHAFCPSCATPTTAEQIACTQCGAVFHTAVQVVDSRPIPPGPQAFQSDKSRVAYILLAFFLGFFGVHNFYAGYVGRALTQLGLNLILFPIITVLTCGVGGLLYFATWVWNIVEMCTVDTDANGNPLS